MIVTSRVWSYSFLILMAAGCSRLQVAYDWADTALIHVGNKYFNLTRMQEKKTEALVRQDLSTMVKKHGSSLKSNLSELIALVKNENLTQTEFFAFFDRSRKLYYQIIEVAEPSTVDVALTLTTAQLDYFGEKLKKDVETKKKDYVSEKYQRSEGRKRTLRWIEMIGLKLRAPQEQLLDSYLSKTTHDFLLAQNHRLHLGDKFLAAARKSPDSLRAFIHQLFINPESLREATYQKTLEKQREQLRQFQWDLLQSLSPQQKVEIENKIRQQIEELEKLQKKAS